MADRKTHRRAGRVAGGVYAAHRAKGQGVLPCAVETLGGVLGGDLGGIVADVLEPALTSWHRGPAHSCVAGAAVLSLGDPLMRFESYCREQAERNAKERVTLRAIPDLSREGSFVVVSADPLGQLWLAICEFFWRMLAGFANGVAAGYLSHLALDAGTFRSIPILTNGF